MAITLATHMQAMVYRRREGLPRPDDGADDEDGERARDVLDDDEDTGTKSGTESGVVRPDCSEDSGGDSGGSWDSHVGELRPDCGGDGNGDGIGRGPSAWPYK